MELSIEEVFDIILEILGCGVAIGLMTFFLNSHAIINFLERLF